MRDAKAQLAADALPLTLAALSGRATYRARPGRLLVRDQRACASGSPGGEEAQPGNFSIERTAAPASQPRVEVRADGIDLKIAATLIDYFPVPHDIKGQVGRFAPRGRIADASLSWSGESAGQPRESYAVKGRFEELAVNPVDAFPGVTGVSGTHRGHRGRRHAEARRARRDLHPRARLPRAARPRRARGRRDVEAHGATRCRWRSPMRTSPTPTPRAISPARGARCPIRPTAPPDTWTCKGTLSRATGHARRRLRAQPHRQITRDWARALDPGRQRATA